jgi:DNA-binding response OmpR family regulator
VPTFTVPAALRHELSNKDQAKKVKICKVGPNRGLGPPNRVKFTQSAPIDSSGVAKNCACSMTRTSILLVDDDRELDLMLTEYLSAEPFSVTTALDGTVALDLLTQEIFDLVILDVMLPSLSGFNVLRQLRQTLSVPVIMLTARGEDSDRILGLELGADDYLPKPFNPKELVASIHAVLRRTAKNIEYPNHTFTVGSLHLNTATLGATVDGRLVRLTGTEFRVLESLVRGAGQAQSRESLTERILGRKLSAHDRSIDTHVSNLRRKLVDERGRGIEIRNIRGAGYLLTGNREGQA